MELICRVLAQICRLARLVQDIVELPGQFFRKIHHIGKGVEHRGDFIDEPGDPCRQAVDLVDVSVRPVHGGIDQGVGRALGFPGAIGNGLEAVGNLVGGAAEIVQRAVCLIAQYVELVEQLSHGSFVVEEPHLRFQLPGDAAHVLTAPDGAAVGAAVQIAGLPPHNAADVVSHMRVAHAARVGAALEDAGGISGNAADVGADRDVFCGVDLIPVEITRIRIGFHLCGVDAAAVFTLDDAAEILPGDPAHIVLAGDGAGKGAVDDLALRFVNSHNAADAVGAGDGSGKGAAGEGAPVAAGDAAERIFPPGGDGAALHCEILHRARGLDIPEQPLHAAAPCDGQAGNGVALPLKAAAKGRDGGEAGAGQVDVGFKADGFALRPGIQRAAAGKADQICRAPDGNNGCFTDGQRGGGRHREQQNRRQEKAEKLMEFHFHLSVPPRFDRSLSPASRRLRRE